MGELSRTRWMALLLAVLAASVLAVGCATGGPVAKVYFASGGDKLVVQSGGEIEVQSGGTLDVQSGATTDHSAGVDLDGAQLILDADGDSSLTADTDDQVDLELEGADTVVFAAVPAADASGSIVEIQFTAPAHTTGTLTVNGLVLDIAAGQSVSGTSHVLTGLQIDGITGDVTTTEKAINIGSGWDTDIDLQNGETIVNSYNGVITATATTFHVQGNETSSGNMTAGTGLVATTGGADLQAGNLVLANDEEIGNEVDGAVTITGTYTILSNWLRLAPQTAISVTVDGYITPTGTMQPLESFGNVETSSLAMGNAGDVLFLYNTVDTTITISDTGVLKLSSDLALGQYDGVWLFCDGTNWMEHGDN